MSDNNIIYEITQKITDKDNLQNDISEAIGLVSNMFREKYINKLQSAVQKKHIEIQKNPSKEIKLMYALKPFLNESSHHDIDNVINAMLSLNTIMTIQNELSSRSIIKQNSVVSTQSIPEDPSIKSDGIYDVDENCLIANQSGVSLNNNGMNVILLFLMFMLIK